jgi:hypothetical protein
MLARQSQRCPRDCSGVLAVAFLEEAQGLLSRFVCVYLPVGYITQGGAGVGLAGCYEPTAQVLLYPYTLTQCDTHGDAPPARGPIPRERERSVLRLLRDRFRL